MRMLELESTIHVAWQHVTMQRSAHGSGPSPSCVVLVTLAAHGSGPCGVLFVLTAHACVRVYRV